MARTHSIPYGAVVRYEVINLKLCEHIFGTTNIDGQTGPKNKLVHALCSYRII